MIDDIYQSQGMLFSRREMIIVLRNSYHRLSGACSKLLAKKQAQAR